MEQALHLALEGTKHQRLTACYFIKNADILGKLHPVAAKIVENHFDDAQTMAIIFTEFMAGVENNLSNLVQDIRGKWNETPDETKEYHRVYATIDNYFKDETACRKYYDIMMQMLKAIPKRNIEFDQLVFNWNKESLKKSILGIAKNPIIIGIVLGMIASIVRLKLPFILDKTLHNFSIMASPLALVGLGAGFEGKKAIKKIKPTVICTFVKLMVWPMLFLPVALYMGFSGEKIIAILVMLGSATTPSSYIMTKNMGHEGVLTSSTIVCTTLFSAFSLTLWLFILKSVGAI